MNLSKKRWLVLAACCLINLCLGSIYTWSVFAGSMADYLNQRNGTILTTADLAIVYTIANAVGPVTMISGGYFNDTFGPKKVIFTGGFLFGLGMFLSGFATSVSFLILTYGIISGLGLGMAYGCTISSCVKFFPDHRGLIGGITTAVYGLSSVLLPPIVTAIVSKSNAAVAFHGIGLLFLAIICISSFFVEKCPLNFCPDGYLPPVQTSQSRQDLNWKGMLATPVFYIMLGLLTCGAFSGMMIISQASSVAVNLAGMNLMSASAAVSVLALFNAFGRIAAGFLSDHLGRINTLLCACLLSILGLFLLFKTASGNALLFYCGISIVGMCFGSFMGVFPGFTADQFGGKNNSVNYGIMFIGFALAGYLGPMVMRNVYAANNSYRCAFLIAMGLSAGGALLCLFYCFLSRSTKKAV